MAAGDVSEADRPVEADLARVLRRADVALEATPSKAPQFELEVLVAVELQDPSALLRGAQARLAPIASL